MGSLNVLLVALLLLFQTCNAYKQHLVVSKDTRQMFFIESFGFAEGGRLRIDINNWKLEKPNKTRALGSEDSTKAEGLYFHVRVLKVASMNAEVLDDIYNCQERNKVQEADVITYERDVIIIDGKPQSIEVSIDSNLEGFHSIFFVNCNQWKVSFSLDFTLSNVVNGQTIYLPVGLASLPTIYFAFSIAYAIMFVIWIFGYMRGKGNVVNKIHYLMSLLVVLKFLSLLFYAIDRHFVKYDGSAEGWDKAYYVFAILRTSLFFVLVTLIGTGWSFFKPFLSDKDKKIIMVVIPLQILDNIAMIFVNVEDPGSRSIFTWKDIFRIVDIVCCGAVLIPIIWSIKHLREASQSDGKAARNLQKLETFRQFYLIVVTYIYFTRIIVYLLDATLPYKLEFMGDVCTELATLAFFCVVGHKFRPMHGNPYFNMEEDDAARASEMRNVDDF